MFQNEYESSDKTLENAFMVWRGTLMILQFENLHEWDWSPLLNSLLKCMHAAHLELRKQKDTNKLIDYLSRTVDRHRMLNIV